MIRTSQYLSCNLLADRLCTLLCLRHTEWQPTTLCYNKLYLIDRETTNIIQVFTWCPLDQSLVTAGSWSSGCLMAGGTEDSSCSWLPHSGKPNTHASCTPLDPTWQETSWLFRPGLWNWILYLRLVKLWIKRTMHFKATNVKNKLELCAFGWMK